MTMTPDQCFDEMAVALGLPKDTGYIDLLDLVKKLKKETEELKHKEYCLRQDAKGYSPSEVQEYREETEELKEENKNLKGGIRALADEMKKMNEENKKLQIPDGVKSCFRTLNDVYFNDESKWYSENYDEQMEGKYEEPEDIPTKHLQDCNYRHLRVVWEWMFDGKYEEYEEEDDEPPDCCEGCGERFDLQYTLNHADKQLREKYDKYMGSEEDDVDLCQICLDSNY